MSERIDRRRFVQTVGGVGIGAIGSLVAADAAEAGQTRTAPQRPAGADDFPKPAGLRTGAQLDSRFPGRAGHWGSAGSLGQVTHHDRSNSKA